MTIYKQLYKFLSCSLKPENSKFDLCSFYIILGLANIKTIKPQKLLINNY